MSSCHTTTQVQAQQQGSTSKDQHQEAKQQLQKAQAAVREQSRILERDRASFAQSAQLVAIETQEEEVTRLQEVMQPYIVYCTEDDCKVLQLRLPQPTSTCTMAFLPKRAGGLFIAPAVYECAHQQMARASGICDCFACSQIPD